MRSRRAERRGRDLSTRDAAAIVLSETPPSLGHNGPKLGVHARGGSVFRHDPFQRYGRGGTSANVLCMGTTGHGKSVTWKA